MYEWLSERDFTMKKNNQIEMNFNTVECQAYSLDCQQVGSIKSRFFASIDEAIEKMAMPVISKARHWALVGSGNERYLISAID